MEPRNLVLTDSSQAFILLSQGYRILLCTEDPVPPEVIAHPNTIKMSIVLPPYEVLSKELNGDIVGMQYDYIAYLMNDPNASVLLDMLVLSANAGNPIALCFGSEVNDLRFGSVLLGYLQNNLGIYFAPNGYGAIDKIKVGFAVERLLMRGELTAMQALSFYPIGIDLSPSMLSQLAAMLCPPVQANELNQYFKNMVRDLNGQHTNRYGQAYFCPFEAGPNVEGTK